MAMSELERDLIRRGGYVWYVLAVVALATYVGLTWFPWVGLAIFLAGSIAPLAWSTHTQRVDARDIAMAQTRRPEPAGWNVHQMARPHPMPVDVDGPPRGGPTSIL